MAVDDIYTKSLLHFNGADTSTTFTDENGRTWTANDNAQLDTAQQKFGSASGLFDGTTDWIDTPDHADFDIGSGDFTIDFWVRRNADGAIHRLAGQIDSAAATTSASFNMSLLADNTLDCSIASGATPYSINSSGTITADSAWHHVALVRDTNTLRLFLAGTADGTVDVTGVTANNSSNKVGIGRLGEFASQYFNGWIDEFRFSKGIARWTTNFTPPTREYGSKGNFFAFF